MQHHGWLEATLQARLPGFDLSLRNLGFGADTLTIRQRTAGFGSADDYLTRCQTDVVFAFFGYNESFDGEQGAENFKKELGDFIEHTRGQEYNGKSSPRLVLFSSIAHEDLGSPNLPSGVKANRRIAAYTKAMSQVARAHEVPFVDLFGVSQSLYEKSVVPLTINGIHLTEEGNRRLAARIVSMLVPGEPDTKVSDEQTGKLREAILAKNMLWFNRYRATDGYNVYGGRSSLEYTDEVSNYSVLQRELEVLDAMCANRDIQIWALARGEDAVVDDGNLPPLLPVKTNKPGELDGGLHAFPTGEEAIAHMEVAEGMKVNLFADEEKFPELENPCQMAWDTRGRLWVAVWPTYPHWEPHQPMNDKLVIFEDTDGDGRADECKTFAGDLHNPTGFEFWNGGVLLAQTPDLLFLKDTDGDDVADVRERLLHGLSSADTHHSANSFVLGPGGALYFQEGTFHQSQVESIYGPVRNHNGAVWRFEPRTFRVERYAPYNFANPHGHVFDRWGQDFVTDGTGNQNYFALGFSGFIPHPDKHQSYFTYFQQRSRPAAATEILSSRHFPPEHQGNLLIADVIQFQGILNYRFVDSGSGFGAQEAEPIVRSPHPTFRPTDIEMGPDGAIYFLDWTNPIIGHMQHHLRDPSRDHDHGRIYRISMEGSSPLEPAKIAGEPIEHLLELLKSPEDRVRYLVRIELSGRDSDAVVVAAKKWIAGLDEADANHEHQLLEGLWVHQQHNTIDRATLLRLLRGKDHRARSAATRVLRSMRHQVPDALTLLLVQAADVHPRVRLEAIVAASFFTDPQAASVALETLRHPGDKVIDYALGETMRALEPVWKAAIQEGKLLSADHPAAVEFLLERVTSEELMTVPRSSAVHQALLTRHGIDPASRREAAEVLGRENGRTPVSILLDAVKNHDSTTAHAAHIIHDLGQVVISMLGEGERPDRKEVLDLMDEASGGAPRQLGYALLMTLDGSADNVLQGALFEPDRLMDFFGAISMLPDENLRASLFSILRPMMFQTPRQLAPTKEAPTNRLPGVRVAYYLPNPEDVALASFDDLTPTSTGVVPNFSLNIPQIVTHDGYALKFTGTLRAPREGHYTFYTNSDDGSRLFIDDLEVVSNDGPHGMLEMEGDVHLSEGPHRITLTYYEAGGAEGLLVSWKGPGIEKQQIPDSVLERDAASALRDGAVRAMSHVPGHAEEKFQDAMLLIGAGSVLDAAVALVDRVPADGWPESKIRPLIDSIDAYARGLPAEQRTLPHVLSALDLGGRLADALPDEEGAQVRSDLKDLSGTVILIRTVPHEMLYDVKAFQVEAGKPVAIVLQNNDVMPHNFVITQQGRLAVVGQAAEKLATRPGGADLSNFIPETEDVLVYSGLLMPGQSERLSFVAPSEVGDYPYVCTFPGHWTRMNGTMKVVDKVNGDPILARTKEVVEEVAVRSYVQSWKLSDLADSVVNSGSNRSLKRGKEMFTVAGCVKCHVVNGEGVEGGPELTKITEKFQGAKLLQQMIEPSSEIHEDYLFYHFTLDDDKGIHGRIMKDDGEAFYVAQKLLEPEDLIILPKDRIKEQSLSEVSSMPTGLLVTLTKEEILDLLAFLESGKE